MNSRRKGKVGELELASVLRQYGFDSHRGQQFRGGQDSPDVTGIPNVHIECKRVEKTDLYAWLEQSTNDAGCDLPVVMHRKNGKKWVVILSLDSFIEIVKGWLSWLKYNESMR